MRFSFFSPLSTPPPYAALSFLRPLLSDLTCTPLFPNLPPSNAALADLFLPPLPPLDCLQDTQLALRTSIRHLRLSRVSPAPLLDPSFASLSRPGAAVGVGGVALGELLKPLGGGEVRWRGTTGKKEGESEGERDDEGGRGRLSVAALELEKEGWEEVVRALEKSRSG